MKEQQIIKLLETNYNIIKDEFNNIDKELLFAWPETQIYTGEWLTFGLYFQSKVIEPNVSLCPYTLDTLNTIPGLINAGFSILKPQTYIKSHVGYSDKVYRYHLGIDVPQSKKYECGLILYNNDVPNLNEDFIKWREGEAFSFNDQIKHSAHNYTNKERVVLLLDVIK
jgi:ornithine lipid ester-linked acyl 2-hydroxylase